MPLTIHSDSNPFRPDDHDTVRIGKTRVTLDTLVAQFHNGDTPEQIMQNFPTLDLADIYSCLGYYIRHQAEVDQYLAARDKEAEEIMHVWQSKSQGLREKLLARRAARQQPTT